MRRSRQLCKRLCLLLLLLYLQDSVSFHCAPQISRIKTGNRERSFLLFAQDDDNREDDKDAAEQLDDWLDKPFFDPTEYDENDDSTWQARLATFVKSDYDVAELVYAGTFLAFMLVVSQELFRMQLYGADYVPFTSNSQTVNALWKSI